MARAAPGKHYREGMTLLEVAEKFGEEAKAREWLEKMRWPDGPRCPHCGSDNVQCNIKHKTMTHRCRDCDDKPMFSVRKGTIMEGSNLRLRVWAIGIYLYTTNIKGISSMKLHRELGITQKSAWFVLHRLRKAAEADEAFFSGPVEADETYFGGKRRSMSISKRKELKKKGRGTFGKAAVVGVKDRETNEVRAMAVPATDAATLQGFILSNTDEAATVYTDEFAAYRRLPRIHEVVRHSVSEYVRDQAHTNGVESFWALMKRGYFGIYHKMSPKHLDRYVGEFMYRHNVRQSDTKDQMGDVVRNMIGKRLKYKHLIADNGLSSGAKPLSDIF